ncbi:MAG: hypothetical protein LAN37_05900 [Acidobacteriia bacterium]|nr:hypothetical protein [Terriglobia bacterium]
MKRKAASIALWLALAAGPAFGQGCAMCYTGAHAAGAKAQKALNRGIGVLMVTTLSMIGGLALLVFRTRNSGQDLHDDEATDPGSPPQ